MKKFTITLTEDQLLSVATAVDARHLEYKMESLQTEDATERDTARSISKKYKQLLKEIREQLEKQVPSVSHTGESAQWYN